MDNSGRQLHHLEKIVVLFALVAALALTVGFAQAGPAQAKRKHDPSDPA